MGGHGLTVAAGWITFAAVASSVGLYIGSAKYSMKAAATDADKAKARNLAMWAFWVLIVALLFALIGAISASCSYGLGAKLKEVLKTARERYLRGGELALAPMSSGLA